MQARAGAIGSRLVPQLVERGHEVVGSSRSPAKVERLAALGAEPVVLDLLDPDAVRKAVDDSPARRDHPPGDRAQRPERLQEPRPGVRADQPAPHRRHRRAARSRARRRCRPLRGAELHELALCPRGRAVKTEEDPLDPDPVPTMRETLDAIRHLEQAAVDAGGIALRYGGFYGSPDDAQLELVRKRRFPIVGDGGGIWSFVHLDDAAAATVLALERGRARDLQRRRRRARAGARVAARAGRQRSARSRRATFRAGSPGSWRARPASR